MFKIILIVAIAIVVEHANADPYFCKKNKNDKFFDIYSDKCFKTNEQLEKVEKLIMIKSTRLDGMGSLCKKNYLHVETLVSAEGQRLWIVI